MLETLKRRDPGSGTGGSSVGLRHPAPDWPSEKSEGPFWRCRATAAAAVAGGRNERKPRLDPNVMVPPPGLPSSGLFLLDWCCGASG